MINFIRGSLTIVRAIMVDLVNMAINRIKHRDDKRVP